jgi:hypothetical protein
MHVVNKCASMLLVSVCTVHVLFSIQYTCVTVQVNLSTSYFWIASTGPDQSFFRVAFSRVHGCKYSYVHFETGAMYILQVEWIHVFVSTREPAQYLKLYIKDGGLNEAEG